MNEKINPKGESIMNQRFEDTYDRATNAICGMAKDYRLLEEQNRLLRARVNLMDDKADILRNKISAGLGRHRVLIDRCSELEDKISGMNECIDVLAMDLTRALEDKVTQCVRCEHPEYHEARFSLSSEFPAPGVRVVEHEESDIDLATQFTKESWAKENDFPFDSAIVRRLASNCGPQVGNFFDVLMWRWVFNTVRL